MARKRNSPKSDKVTPRELLMFLSNATLAARRVLPISNEPVPPNKPFRLADPKENDKAKRKYTRDYEKFEAAKLKWDQLAVDYDSSIQLMAQAMYRGMTEFTQGLKPGVLCWQDLAYAHAYLALKIHAQEVMGLSDMPFGGIELGERFK